MNEFETPPQENNKNLLVVLGLALVFALTMLGYVVYRMLYAAEERSVAIETDSPAQVERTVTQTQSQWTPPPAPPSNLQRKAAPVDDDPAALPINKEARDRQIVHQQAETLRQMIRENRLPRSYGNLTLERVDEMEKKGICIW